jgi:hypothetical protein
VCLSHGATALVAYLETRGEMSQRFIGGTLRMLGFGWKCAWRGQDIGTDFERATCHLQLMHRLVRLLVIIHWVSPCEAQAQNHGTVVITIPYRVALRPLAPTRCQISVRSAELSECNSAK